MKQLNIKYKNINTLHPYKKNAKKHDKKQVEQIANSIKEFGFTQPVIIDKSNCVVAGHGRILGAKKAGLKEVPTVCLEELTEEQIKAYRLIDNKLNESEWDDVLLAQELEELDKEQMKLFGFDLAEEIAEEEKKYTMKTNIPQYDIKGEQPEISELCDTSKTRELLEKIKQSNVSEEEKKFLRYGAYRHLCFNYSKIAEYYAQANKEMQELMEDSALVIIDFEDAIAKGYVEMSKQVALLRGDDNEA
jgi:ParB/RepB/Spo0J family partition protein